MNQPNSSLAPSDLEGASSDTSFGDILTQFEQEHHLDKGQTLHGTVVAISAESIFVNIGRKTEGILPLAHFQERTSQETAKVGDQLVVSVTGRNEEGYYQLSTIKVERPRDWSALETAFTEKRTVAGTVTEVVKGGLRVDIGVRAFMPASRSGAREQADMEKLVGQEIQCRITKLDTAKEDVVVDRRVVLEEEETKTRVQAFERLKVDTVIRGTVRSLTDFGAFVDLGGFDGLLHVTDMSWTRTAKPADVVAVGDSIEVKILKINADTRRISLGLKQLIPDPWTVAATRYEAGQRVQGKVTRTTDFGAFVELEPGIEGMIHLSEMSWIKKVRKPSDVVKPDDQVDVVVLGVNAPEHRIALGLKQALGDPWDAAAQKYPVGSVAEGAITSMQKFGAFVDLGDGIEGMIHIGDISREKRLDHPQEMLKTGQKVKAQILELDRDRRRIRLGMKQLEPTSADEYIAEHQAGETVSGRIVDASPTKAKIELGEGVYATCRLEQSKSESGSAKAVSSGADISSLGAMLTAKWKSGAGGAAPEKEPLRAGQVRSFRLLAMDPAQKKIDVQLID